MDETSEGCEANARISDSDAVEQKDTKSDNTSADEKDKDTKMDTDDEGQVINKNVEHLQYGHSTFHPK